MNLASSRRLLRKSPISHVSYDFSMVDQLLTILCGTEPSDMSD
jgi:hypothetical protein